MNIPPFYLASGSAQVVRDIIIPETRERRCVTHPSSCQTIYASQNDPRIGHVKFLFALGQWPFQEPKRP